MHTNDGVGIDLVKLVRYICKLLDAKQNEHLMSVKKEISSLEDQLGSILGTIT